MPVSGAGSSWGQGWLSNDGSGPDECSLLHFQRGIVGFFGGDAQDLLDSIDSFLTKKKRKDEKRERFLFADVGNSTTFNFGWLDGWIGADLCRRFASTYWHAK